MALSASGMKSLIKSKIEAISNYPQSPDSPVFADERILQALCEGIVEHITGNAVVPSTGTVTTGPGSGGAVVASGTVT